MYRSVTKRPPAAQMRMLGKGKHLCNYLMQVVQIRPFKSNAGEVSSVTLNGRPFCHILRKHKTLGPRGQGWNIMSLSHVTLFRDSIGPHLLFKKIINWEGGMLNHKSG